MKNRFITVVLIIIVILLAILSISCISMIKRPMYNAPQIKTENQSTIDNEERIPLYEQIGVSKRCLYVWQVLTAEGFWPNPEPSGCSQDDIDKIEEYCKDMFDSCYNYDTDDI